VRDLEIPSVSDSPAIDLAIDTIRIGKQALIFCNTKSTAEATAEKIAGKIKDKTMKGLSEQVLHALSSPTRQCKRLASCIEKGIAFHHAGLAHSQRKIVEDNFRKGDIKIICCTPTLAFGLNLPAFRAIMKDLKRYGGRWGMQWIPVLEYQQCIGRAGRPDFNDRFGEAISISQTEGEKDTLIEKYLKGEPEPVLSKLAVEPVLRTYVLSLVAMDFVTDRQRLKDFFAKTLYGHQYGDIEKLDMILSKIIKSLAEWGFLEKADDDFMSADQMEKEALRATPLGARVSQLYIDPFTANLMICAMRRTSEKMADEHSFVHMAANTFELKPYFNVRTKELEAVEEYLNEIETIVLEPSIYEAEYDEFLNATKTSLVLSEWMDEEEEDTLLDKYNVRPGELAAKKDNCDWVLYGAEEVAKILGLGCVSLVRKTRFRLNHGIKEELISLVRLKGIGRVRARKLFRNNIRDIGDIKKADVTVLAQLVGKATALDIKKQVGEDIEAEKGPEGKRKGQKSMEDY